MSILVEACVDSLAAAQAAVAAGADRLELCQDLNEGGTTPGLELLAEVREQVALPLHVLVRPPGDFCYAGDEIAGLLRDIAAVRRLGADAVVVGALTPDRRVDLAAMRRLLAAARPLAVTFHRAFDESRDPFEALDALLDLGIERLLTSGQAATAAAGIPLLRALVTRAAGRIGVLAGGGVRADNVSRIVAATGVQEVHLRYGEWFSEVVARVNG